MGNVAAVGKDLVTRGSWPMGVRVSEAKTGGKRNQKAKRRKKFKKRIERVRKKIFETRDGI